MAAMLANKVSVRFKIYAIKRHKKTEIAVFIALNPNL